MVNHPYHNRIIAKSSFTATLMKLIAIMTISVALQLSHSISSSAQAFDKSLLTPPSNRTRGVDGEIGKVLNITITEGATSPMSQMAGSAYFPSQDQVNRTDKVTWNNTDSAVHTVTSSGPNHLWFDSGNISPGKSWWYVFNESGTFQYYCKLHPYMTGTIYVK
jgi:plastocyanin